MIACTIIIYHKYVTTICTVYQYLQQIYINCIVVKVQKVMLVPNNILPLVN